MIDVKAPIRKAYYDLLNGSLFVNGVSVPVSDDLKKLQDASANMYVLLTNQQSTNLDTMQSWDSQEDMVVDIVYKAARTNKETVDSIAGQILNRVLPAPGIDGLGIQTGVQINCVRINSDQYLPIALGQTQTMTRRIITFRQRARQTLDSTVMPGLSKITRVTSSDFTDSDTYNNANLSGVPFELFFNSASRFLDYGIEWEYQLGGGFKVLLPDFNATLNVYEFYVLLK